MRHVVIWNTCLAKHILINTQDKGGKSMSDYDYIIIGGGPAGSTAAYCLQKEGAKCIIIEKKNK